MAGEHDGAAVDAPLDRALDELYAVDPSEFVATRKQLVARLRADGETAAAKEIGAARRPTTAAWVLNQVARRYPAVVEALLEHSRALSDAQDRAVAGDPGALREATRTQREAMRDAVAAATAVGGPVAASIESQILATLYAAAADDDAGQLLRRGLLVREVDATGGFPDGGVVPERSPDAPEPRPTHLRVVPETSAAHATASQPGRGRGGQPDREVATREVAAREAAEREVAFRARLGAAETKLRDARAEADALEAVARDADARIDELRRALDGARGDARAAKRASTDARRKVEALEQAFNRVAARRDD